MLKLKILEDKRFWPVNPVEGEQPVFRKPQTWQEACVVAKEYCSVEESSRAFAESAFPAREAQATGQATGERVTPPWSAGVANPSETTEATGAEEGGRRRRNRNINRAGGSVTHPQDESTYVAEGTQSEKGSCHHCGRGGHTTK